ncbi:MAG: ATP-binding protein [Deltaproteobacteria bacterium]|nr:ATP-binding protein [Deltaproteobacteria bacterium]
MAIQHVKNPLLSQSVATPHFTQEEKTPEVSLSRLSKGELSSLCKNLHKKVRELENLVQVVSRGKYTWESTFDAIAEPVMIVSPDYKVERANIATARVGKREITKVAGQKCFEVFAHRNTPCENCPLTKAIGGGELSRAHLGNKIHTKDFEAHAYPLYDEKGKLESAVMYYRDITEEIRLKEEVIQQEKMAAIGMLAGGVAHEVNNPLGGVLAFTQLLLQKTEKGSETYEDLVEIEHAATRCKKIVQELLDFSRISKDREKCPVYVNMLLEKVTPFVQMEIRSLNIDLQFDLSPDVPPVMAISNRLQQVFLNLMTNACHAMPHGGKLLVSTRFDKKAGDVLIAVKDTGVGMPKEIKERVFEPFFTTKDPGKGTGLGLSISFRIVKENNGRIEVDSHEGKGSTFTIRLPAI